MLLLRTEKLPKGSDLLYEIKLDGYRSIAGNKLMYAARTRNGFTSKLREELMKKFRGLQTDKCPFANLPEKKAGRWGAGLTAAKMVDCRWLKPVLVGQFEFVEWTSEGHLRHSRFTGLREDKSPKDVVRKDPRPKRI